MKQTEEDAAMGRKAKRDAWAPWRKAEAEGMSWKEWQEKEPEAYKAWCAVEGKFYCHDGYHYC